MAGLFENLRARELREWSNIKNFFKKEDQESCGRIGCTNRPLRCCCRLLFSLTGVKKELSPAQEKEAAEEEEKCGEKHTKDKRVYLYRCLILEHGGQTQLGIYARSGDPPRKGLS